MTWKERRKLSYLINDFDDIDLPHRYIKMNDEELISLIIHFFETESDLIYPAKSFFVAIIYAKNIEKIFGQNFYDVLNDKDLLPDDLYFKTYSEAQYIYDSVLNKIEDIWNYKSINTTLKYFYQEFLIGTDNQTYVGMQYVL